MQAVNLFASSVCVSTAAPNLLLLALLLESPPDAAQNLRGADDAGEDWPLVECVHQVLPRLRSGLPGQRVFLRMNECHDSVADKNHGGEVLPACRCEEHERTSWMVDAPDDAFVG